jgi:hypothetical protein
MKKPKRQKPIQTQARLNPRRSRSPEIQTPGETIMTEDEKKRKRKKQKPFAHKRKVNSIAKISNGQQFALEVSPRTSTRDMIWKFKNENLAFPVMNE